MHIADFHEMYVAELKELCSVEERLDHARERAFGAASVRIDQGPRFAFRRRASSLIRHGTPFKGRGEPGAGPASLSVARRVLSMTSCCV
jgi:hypothetical protein